MGWDTKIIIIAEKIDSKIIAQNIANEIYESDSKNYGIESYFIITATDSFSLYFSYERRKYIPYWVIQEISKKNPSVHFTVIGSMVDFIAGPGGIVKIENEKIKDSYGIFPFESLRKTLLEFPVINRELIFEWYKINGKESILRGNFIDLYPMNWCNENYIEKIIPIEDNQLKHLELNVPPYDWGVKMSIRNNNSR